MPSLTLGKARLAGTLALLVAGVVAIAGAGPSAGAQEAPAQLLPDLKTIRPYGLRIERNAEEAGGRKILRFSNEVFNRGAGPMELDPEGECPGEPTGRAAYQDIYQDTNENGVFDGEDTSVQHDAGCTHYHDAHDHWHFDDFARYELLEYNDDGTVGELAQEWSTSEKVSFCLVDTKRIRPWLPSSPQRGHYFRCDEDAATGISIGWSDVYGAGLPHQWVDITNVPAGTYCLRSTADPSDRLEEIHEDNNGRGLRLSIYRTQVDFKPRRPCVSS